MGMTPDITGPLVGTRVVELAGIGPSPHACMILADLGATVVRVERPTTAEVVPGTIGGPDATNRGRDVVVADLKDPTDFQLVRSLIAQADVLVEGFRPGVAERLGLGPEEMLAQNPGLVYGRMTGWGQDGQLSSTAGHDLNYIALTGVLDNIGPADRQPVPPLNLVGDFGGGSMFLVVGVLAGLLERATSGHGQVIDAAIVDGTSVLAQMMWATRAMGRWHEGRGRNFLDGSVPFYRTYETADGKAVAVGSLEPQFFHAMLAGVGLMDCDISRQWDESTWPAMQAALEERFRSRTRDQWAAVFAGSDACVTPVLTFAEALAHPHLVQRGTFSHSDGVDMPTPAPRFSRTPPTLRGLPDAPMDLALAVKRWQT